MSGPFERTEYFKGRGVTLAVSTCQCCLDRGYQDAWRYDRTGPTSIGIRWSTLRDHYTIITQREAYQRSPVLKEREERNEREWWERL